MSDRPCNYCGYLALKYTSEKQGQIVTKKRAGFGSFGAGVNIYVHPPEVDIDDLHQDEAKQYFKVWYAELPNHCCC